MAFEYRLTTIDNPYDPFDDFVSWYYYDIDKGYDSCSKIARIANTSNALTDSENAMLIEDAINEIIKHDFRGIYVKVKKEVDFDEIVTATHKAIS